MDVRIIGDAVLIREGGERLGYTYRARVLGLDGWTVEFDITYEPSRITRLELRPDRRSAPTLSTTMLRHLNPSELVNAAADPFLLESDGPWTLPTHGQAREFHAGSRLVEWREAQS